jgi:hypothetical protein
MEKKSSRRPAVRGKLVGKKGKKNKKKNEEEKNKIK